MRKLLLTAFILSMSLSVMTGCGKKEEDNNLSGPVIIRAGDSAVGSGGKKEQTTSTEASVDTTNKETTPTEVSTEAKEEEYINLSGVWLGNNGSCLEIGSESFSALLNGIDVGGFYTASSKKLTLTYGVTSTIDDATEEQKLLGQDKLVEEKVDEYDILSYSEGVAFTLSGNGIKEMFSYFGPVTDTSGSDYGAVTDVKEIESIRQQLIANGINPDTNISFEDEKKLIEMGIDPATGEPLEIEVTGEEVTEESKANNK